jgi:hypothetical protein
LATVFENMYAVESQLVPQIMLVLRHEGSEERVMLQIRGSYIGEYLACNLLGSHTV